MAQQMTADYKNLPASVLAKIAELEHQCISLSTKLDRSRRDLQGLRVQQRDRTPEPFTTNTRPIARIRWHRGFFHTRFPARALGKPLGSVEPFRWERGPMLHQ